VKITTLTDDLKPKLESFCKKAEALGYENNSSLDAMKYDWCKEIGRWLCAIEDNEIIAVAGSHPLPEVSKNAWRIMFRGCELPQTDNFKGLGKGDWNSITQREMIPIFIDWCPSNELYITTNIYHEHSNGKAARNHKLMGLLAKQKILDKHSEMILYYTEQAVWKLNIEEYQRRRNMLGGKYVG
tara:strand:+ start:13098 stop:13649 length:552 start_codon:yes stop_codon:yes gene_type:complete